MQLDSQLLNQLISFRHELHRHPELSGGESSTSKRVEKFLKGHHPTQIIKKLGDGHGMAVVFDSKKKGPTVVLRCELDALPIHEETSLTYRSVNPGVSHKCGHDGHMATLVGLAPLIEKYPLKKGKVVLLFQQSEETGDGAKAIIEDPRLNALKPSCIFGFHNVPIYPLHTVLIKEGTFAMASAGVKISLKGHKAHSSYPEHGHSPGLAVADLIQNLPSIPRKIESLLQYTKVTIVSASLGAENQTNNFGIAPGEGEVLAIVRAENPHDFHLARQTVLDYVQSIALTHELNLETSWHEEFPATVNHSEQVNFLDQCAQKVGLDVQHLNEPFRWSEDFSYYTQKWPGAFFGLGSGMNCHQLHHNHYDYPDKLILTGLKLWWSLLEELVY